MHAPLPGLHPRTAFNVRWPWQQVRRGLQTLALMGLVMQVVQTLSEQGDPGSLVTHLLRELCRLVTHLLHETLNKILNQSKGIGEVLMTGLCCPCN